jgi:hypothetical protein
MVDDRCAALEPSLTALARTFAFIHETMEGRWVDGGSVMRPDDEDE